jgi:PPOX class probable F420-dependent enzyme
MPIPPEIHGQKYICLITFRRTGDAVSTPVWFAEKNDKLYVKTRRDAGKCKRIRNNPRVRVAPCTIRGKVTGPEFEAYARILPDENSADARSVIEKKYWMARLSLSNKLNVYLEIEVKPWSSDSPTGPGKSS